MGVLFLLCLLAVFHLLHYLVVLAVVLASLLAADRPLLRRVDYSLLLTFICFFIFAGNLGAAPALRTAISTVLARNTALTAGAASQIISNVPAAVLLAGFTQDWRGLLVGTNLGGLGTPIASLASLISLRFYLKSPNARLLPLPGDVYSGKCHCSAPLMPVRLAASVSAWKWLLLPCLPICCHSAVTCVLPYK